MDIQHMSSTPRAEMSQAQLDGEIEALLAPTASDEVDLSRRTGDLKVYAYYARTTGWVTLGLYILLCAAYVIAANFSCKENTSFSEND